jgi:hypothetical protein
VCSHRVNDGLAALPAKPIVQRTEQPRAARGARGQPNLLKMTLPSGALAGTRRQASKALAMKGLANVENPRAGGGFLSRAMLGDGCLFGDHQSNVAAVGVDDDDVIAGHDESIAA